MYLLIPYMRLHTFNDNQVMLSDEQEVLYQAILDNQALYDFGYEQTIACDFPEDLTEYVLGPDCPF